MLNKTYILSSTIHNSPKLETTQTMNSRIDQEVVIHSHGILWRNKKCSHDNMNESNKTREQKKSAKKEHIQMELHSVDKTKLVITSLNNGFL